MRVTKLEQVGDVWRARVTVNSVTVAVDRRYGSWRITPKADGEPYRELAPSICAELQRRVRPRERKAKALATVNGPG